jgi:hypothetical protein
MAEYILSEALIPNELSVRVFADDSDNLPTRVEVQGITGRYRFILTAPDRSRSFTTTFDSATTISRSISNAVASRYTPQWQIGVEGI